MLEQDFIGYRRNASQEKGSSTWWRSSLSGASSLVEKEEDHVHRRSEVRPSVQTAQMQPTHISELGHSQLAMLAVSENHFAHRERLLREIMAVDNCSWEKAHDILYEMDE